MVNTNNYCNTFNVAFSILITMLLHIAHLFILIVNTMLFFTSLQFKVINSVKICKTDHFRDRNDYIKFIEPLFVRNRLINVSILFATRSFYLVAQILYIA